MLTLCKFTSIKHVLYVTASASKPGSNSLQAFKSWIIHHILLADAQNKASTFPGLPSSSQDSLALVLQEQLPWSLGAV